MATASHSKLSISFFLCILYVSIENTCTLPLVINTWNFNNATNKAWTVLKQTGTTAMDALVAGCTECERQQCDGTVGFGGSPDESGETTLDAMVMDGRTSDVGAVGDLRQVKNVIGVARAVMEFTQHTILVGKSATKFAVEMGFTSESLATNRSVGIYKDWKNNSCQPNYRENVSPDPKKYCGPYKPDKKYFKIQNSRRDKLIGRKNHDTIGMLVVDSDHNIVGGTSTNGANHKVPGRVGDSPIVGAGAYARNNVGGAAATGDGDIMMRFLPSFHAVMLLEMGYTVEEAASRSLKPIIKYYPDFTGAVIVANVNGSYGAACHGLSNGFPYSVRTSDMKEATIITVPCI
ncbi:hypothetical protein LOTGIDRAFT_218839 [Lottia gigantea]|uniref:N(4)-(beta-N-acetylglucosaminyl)-L-asparaginase n=1 Tax=Lottia gigantea TaxID=225164 RepID=V3ZYI5_LOTGI|nr:hypothetical protein LOTGIDRAFT_218839 [Lottia gigantea]ESO89442.1 hypothetical protein LOTGIDRAFT_218839 [Lottia gigantea]